MIITLFNEPAIHTSILKAAYIRTSVLCLATGRLLSPV